MRTICLYFEIHQIIHLKRYRFFDIGADHYYYDDYANETGINEVAERSYIPALNTLIEMVKNSGGAFKVALSISGVALEQLEIHAPAVIDLLHILNDTGCCEFLAEPYSHGLSSLANEDCFREEVMRQSEKMKQMFGKAPKVFRNSSLIYSDEIGATVASMGFKGMLTEGAKHVLGWKSPHYVYHCNQAPSLKLLLRDFKLSDDISLRFSNSDWSEYPLFADKFIGWIDALPQEEQVINIFMELKALGMAQPLSSNILEFLKALPYCAKEKGITTMAIVNVVGSSIAREADKVFYTLAGPEISVATTKAYSAQLAAMYCLAVQFAKVRGKITEEQYGYYIAELLTIPEKIQKILEDKERLQWFAAKYANASDVFFVGRGIDYAVCLEGSLKLKEISYIHSEAYAAGELKHGTISLIEQGTLVIGVLTQNELYEKTISNMLECKSRGAYLMGMTTYGNYEIEDQVNFAVYVPKVDEHFMASLAVIPLQLLGYYVSVAKGLDVDKPRNLAKSVTVE